MISTFSSICFILAPRTFNNFPRRGKTPKYCVPITLNPATTNALALSPSQKIIVQSLPNFPPANTASSSFAIPLNRVFFSVWISTDVVATVAVVSLNASIKVCFISLFSVCVITNWLFNIVNSDSFFQFVILSSSDNNLITFQTNSSEITHSDPNCPVVVVKYSLLCESNFGFKMSAWINKCMCFLILL